MFVENYRKQTGFKIILNLFFRGRANKDIATHECAPHLKTLHHTLLSKKTSPLCKFPDCRPVQSDDSAPFIDMQVVRVVINAGCEAQPVQKRGAIEGVVNIDLLLEIVEIQTI